MARDKKEKKPLPKALRVAKLAGNLAVWSDGVAYAPGAIKDFLKKEEELASEEKKAS